jgi:hypothetical protein
VLPKALNANGQDFFILNPAQDSFNLEWVVIELNSNKIPIGDKRNLTLGNLTMCTDFELISNTQDNNAYLLCSVDRLLVNNSQGALEINQGYIKAYYLTSDGNGGYNSTQEAPW